MRLPYTLRIAKQTAPSLVRSIRTSTTCFNQFVELFKSPSSNQPKVLNHKAPILQRELWKKPLATQKNQKEKSALEKHADKVIEQSLLPNAKAGNAEAQFELGHMYRVLNDFTESIKWWQEAADNECIAAQFLLGQLYQHGNSKFGITQDCAKALKWYRKVAINKLDNNFSKEAINSICTMADNGNKEASRVLGEVLMLNN